MKPGENVSPPAVQVPVRVTLLGSGDAFGSGGRLQACVWLAAGPAGYLLDCGASSLIALRRAGVDPNSIHAILLTHLHGDHFGGVPFFILDAQLYSRRTAPLVVAGPPGTQQRVEEAMEVLFPGSSQVRRRFEVEHVEWQDGAAVQIAGATFTPFTTCHASGATSFALRAEVAGRALCCSGDTEWCPALPRASAGADAFIVEALTFDRKLKGHLDYQTLRSHWGELTARRVVLTHLGPELLAHLGAVSCEVGFDGMELDLSPPPTSR